jgi:hypothetical protein
MVRVLRAGRARGWRAQVLRSRRAVLVVFMMGCFESCGSGVETFDSIGAWLLLDPPSIHCESKGDGNRVVLCCNGRRKLKLR